MKKTLLYDEHIKANGRMVEFAGFEMPVEYEGLRKEHDTVRNNVGLFDVSHMGEIRFTGPKALESLQWLTTNDVSKLQAGQAQYSLLPNDKGGLVDDIIVYCLEPNHEYFVCVNAANIEKDYRWMVEHNRGSIIKNESEQWSQIAVQGPKARDLTHRIFPEAKSLKYFQFLKTNYQGVKVYLACTGYTGEDGFEIFVENAQAAPLWRELLKKGEDLGVKPIGLGARDTLRTEMKYSLYGHEIDDKTNSIEAGLGWVIKPSKGEFMGKAFVANAKPTQKLVGIKMVDKGIPRAGYSLLSFDKTKIGTVTSGTLSPTLNEGIGIAFVKLEQANEGTEVFVDIRGKPLKAKIVKTPFVTVKSTIIR